MLEAECGLVWDWKPPKVPAFGEQEAYTFVSFTSTEISPPRFMVKILEKFLMILGWGRIKVTIFKYAQSILEHRTYTLQGKWLYWAWFTWRKGNYLLEGKAGSIHCNLLVMKRRIKPETLLKATFQGPGPHTWLGSSS